MSINTNLLQKAQFYFDKGNLDEARHWCGKSLAAMPDSVPGIELMLRIVLAQNDHQAALEQYDQLIALNPSSPDYWFRKAWFHQERQQNREAAEAYGKVLQFNPDHFEALINLGNVLRQAGAAEKALPLYQKAITLKPDSFESYFNLGLTLMDLGRPEAAIKAFEITLNVHPGYKNALLLMGYSYRILDQKENARRSFGEILKTDASDPDALLGTGYTYHEDLNFDTADQLYRQVLEAHPDHVDAHWNRATLLLVQGKFTEGWQEFEWRKKLKRYPKFNYSQPEWNGDKVTGKTLLLEAEQGFGDSIQCIRYARRLKDMGASIIVACPKPLFRLFSALPYIDQTILQDQTRPAFDVYSSLMSLPHYFGSDLDSIPADIPYLNVSQDREVQIPAENNHTLKIGISWAGNPLNSNDRKRSCALADFSILLSLPGVHFYSLQFGPQRDQLGPFVERGTMIDLTPGITDFMDSAAFISKLDLIITVDSAPAHLAGALGIPVWMVIPYFPDWRWLLDREDSPWYPTMRIFRQPQAGKWSPVFERVKNMLVDSIRKKKMN